MSVKLLTEHHLEFLCLKRGCTGSSEYTHVKMPNCWQPHIPAHICLDTMMPDKSGLFYLACQTRFVLIQLQILGLNLYSNKNWIVTPGLRSHIFFNDLLSLPPIQVRNE